MPLLQSWVLFVMMTLVPNAEWENTYEQTSVDIARESWDHPLHGAGSEFETAAYLLAFGYTESRYHPEEMGDCREGQEKSIATCQSFGLFQVGKVHAPVSELLVSSTATHRALELLRTSMRICQREKPEYRFAWYAKGGNGCSEKGFQASAYRYGIAKRILREYPLP